MSIHVGGGGGGGGGTPSWRGLLVVFGTKVTPTDGSVIAFTVSQIQRPSADLTPTVAASQIVVNTPGWYRVRVAAFQIGPPVVGVAYHLVEGDAINYADSTTNADGRVAPTTDNHTIFMNIDGFYQFSDAQNILEFGVWSTDVSGAAFAGWLSAEFLGPSS